MRDKKEFYNITQELDGRRYDEYQNLIGDFDYSRYVLKINSIAPEGEQTLIVVRVPQIVAAFPPHYFNSPVRRTALEDFLTRKVASSIEGLASYDGSGISRRRLFIAAPEQKILPRTSLVVTEEYVEARIYVELASTKGRIDSSSLHGIFFEDLTQIVNNSLIYCNLPEKEASRFVDVMEDADQVRQILSTRGFVSFVAEDSILPREGDTEFPATQAKGFGISEELVLEVEVPNQNSVKGYGIPTGLTVILGDDYSGRIDFMNAIAGGIYNHIPDDGREFTVTVPDAVKITAEASRSVQRVDLSPFIQAANGADISRYSTGKAAACAGQAASTMEALEVGARVLLFDEADSSISFLSGDNRLRSIGQGTERISPLSAHVKELVDQLGVSVIVGGNSTVAEFIPHADLVLRMDNFEISDVTAEAKAAGIQATSSVINTSIVDVADKARWVVPTSMDASSGKEDECIQACSRNSLSFGTSCINLEAVTQLADIHQTETIGRILHYAKSRYMDEGRPVREILDLIDRDLSSEGLECLTRELSGKLARPRRYEIAAALNRLQTLRISHAGA